VAPRSKSSYNSAVPPPSPTQADRLLEQFEAGKFTDCIVRVSFPEAEGAAGPASSSSSAAVAPTAAAGKGKARRPTKKAKTSETAEAASSTDNGTGRTEDILCHAVILSSRSPYFDSALSRGWSEGEKKVGEIALADEAAVEDLKLLLRLSYGGKLDMRPLCLALCCINVVSVKSACLYTILVRLSQFSQSPTRQHR